MVKFNPVENPKWPSTLIGKSIKSTSSPEWFGILFILSYPITLGSRRGTTDEFAAIPNSLVLFSNALIELVKTSPVHSLILHPTSFSVCLFSFPFTAPFDPRDILLYLQIGFSFARAAVACAILDRIFGLEPSSETIAPRYLKLVTVSSFCPFYLNLPLDAIGIVCHQFCLLSADVPSYTLCTFCRDFQIGLLVPALYQLSHLCHRQIADW